MNDDSFIKYLKKHHPEHIRTTISGDYERVEFLNGFTPTLIYWNDKGKVIKVEYEINHEMKWPC